MDAVETYEHAGIPVAIFYDDCCESPREWSNVGTILHWHRRYDLGEAIGGNAEEALRRGGLPLLERYLRLTRGATVVLPIGMLDHSGVTIWVGGGSHWSDSAGWDSGTVGVIFDTPEGREVTGVSLDDVEQALRGEVEVYARYLEGQTYGYEVADGTPEEDSCWGFIGDEHVMEAANEAAEYAAKAREERITRERVFLLDPALI